MQSSPGQLSFLLCKVGPAPPLRAAGPSVTTWSGHSLRCTRDPERRASCPGPAGRRPAHPGGGPSAEPHTEEMVMAVPLLVPENLSRGSEHTPCTGVPTPKSGSQKQDQRAPGLHVKRWPLCDGGSWGCAIKVAPGQRRLSPAHLPSPLTSGLSGPVTDTVCVFSQGCLRQAGKAEKVGGDKNSLLIMID